VSFFVLFMVLMSLAAETRTL